MMRCLWPDRGASPAALCGAALVSMVLLLGAVGTRASDTQDPRLSQLVTLDLVQVPLSDLCGVMERRSGVTHRPKDTATGDLLASVVGTLTVAQLQQALAAVLDVQWKRTGKGEGAGYEVERLPAKQAEEVRELAETDRAWAAGVQQLRAAAALPPDQQNELPRDLQLRLRPGLRETLQLLGDLTPAEQAQVLAGGGVERSVASLSPEAQARVQAIATEQYRQRLQRLGEMRATNSPFADRVAVPEKPLNVHDGDDWRIRIGPWSRLGEEAETFYGFSLFSPRQFGFEQGLSVSSARPESQDPAWYHLSGPGGSEEPGAKHAERGASGASGPGPMPPAIAPAPLPEGFQLPDDQSWEEIMRGMARALGRPVVSDAYRPTERVPVTIGPPVKADTLESYLDRACRIALHRRWGQAGPALLFQRCDWASQRRSQIPESAARRWWRQVIDTGGLSVDHLAEMASLSPYQLPNLGEVVGRPVNRVAEYQALLLLWKELPAASRRALRGDGLAIRDLPLAVQPRARALVGAMLGSPAPLLLSSATVRVEQTPEAFAFSVHVPDRPVVAQRIDLTCPAWWVELLRKDAEARAAALETAAQPPEAGRAAGRLAM